MKRPLLAILLAIACTVGAANTSQALHTGTLQDTNLVAARDQTEDVTTDETTSNDKKLELEARKQELEQKLADKRAAITKKLMGDRAEKCEKKQGNINAMLDKRVESAQKHFNTFKAIQDKLNVVVDDNAIVVENEVALQRVMNLLQAKAQGSITTLQSSDFKCKDADDAAPGAIVKDQVSTAKQDLKNYRDAIKDYAQAIKASVEATRQTSAEDEPATQEAPIEETPSTEQSTDGASQ